MNVNLSSVHCAHFFTIMAGAYWLERSTHMEKYSVQYQVRAKRVTRVMIKVGVSSFFQMSESLFD
ncbi:MAG: hypothetical protein K0A94_09830 [Desulfuromonadales bacterium]|nr:hypothetical protein [Desulfuromonadales bacterium]